MSNDIWVLAEHQDGRVKKVTYELLSASTQFSIKTGAKVTVILLGNSLQEAVKSLPLLLTESFFGRTQSLHSTILMLTFLLWPH